jgi:hypothetical protein
VGLTSMMSRSLMAMDADGSCSLEPAILRQRRQLLKKAFANGGNRPYSIAD